MYKIIRVILFLIVVSFINSYAAAGIREKQDISKIVQKADKIIRVKVFSTQSQWKEDQRGRHIYTTVDADIIDRIKGDIADDFISFEVVGGTVGDITEIVSDSPGFKIDDDAIILLAGNPLTIKRGINGKIPIYDGKIYRENRAVTADSFIQALKNLQRDPNIDVSLEELAVPMEQAAAAECYVYSGYKWPGANPNITYKINENTSDCSSEGAAVQAAANSWNNDGGNFTFTYGGTHTSTTDSYNGVNEIMWGTTQDSVATTSTWVTGDTTIVECDIVFDDSYNWSSTTPTSSQMDVQTVALHEFGHWFSLDDLYNSEDSGNVMYGYVSNGQMKRTLQSCDIQGICSIYSGCGTSYTLTVNSSGASSVSITSSTGHGGTTNYTKTVSSGGSVSLTAPATSGGKTFNGWTGSVTSSNQTISLTMNANKTVTANYIAIAPSNDTFANAITITGNSGQTTGTNTNATKETGEPLHDGKNGGASVWWKWTAPASGQASINTNGSNFDTLLGVYTGSSVGSLTVIASDDDDGDGTQSLVNFSAVSGTTYRIAVDGYSAATGNITLNWSLTPNYTLSVNSSGTSSVSISSSTGHGGTTNYTKTVASGTSVTLTAPSTSGGKAFTGWTGAVTSGNLTISFSMDGEKTVTANYATPNYTLNVNSSGASAVNISSSSGHGGTTNYNKVVASGTNVSLTAPITAGGNSFKEWQRNGSYWTNTKTADFTMNADYTFTVVYEQVSPDTDLDNDGISNFIDFAFFSNFWQNTSCQPPDWCEYTDINRDGKVNINDLELFAEFWLTE